MNYSEKPNYRKFDDISDKAFFAAYLNTAKQNVFIVFRDISERLGLGFDLNDDDNMLDAVLWKKLTSNIEPEISSKIIDKIKDKFPYANYLVKNYAWYAREERQAQPGDYFEVFKIFIKQLYDFRNYYTHAEHDSVGTPNEIIKGMQLLFDAARREVKKRFELSTKDMDHLVRLTSVGKGKNLKTVERSDFKYSFSDSKGNLTEKGFAYFVCLWLQRKDAQLFLKKLERFKRGETPSQKATLETYTFYSLHLPQPKLQSDNNTAGVLLDMVNELKRSPKHLYPLLDEANKKKFLKKPEGSESPDSEVEYEALPILKRSSNRFFYFALKYFDTVFEQVKFHIDLGNYSFHVYDKKVDNQIRKRRWIKKMTAFGNLDGFSDDKRPKDWTDKIQKIEDRDIESGEIYMTETTPHYHINGNNIGIKFRHNYQQMVKENKIWPELSDFDEENPNTTKPRTKAPDAWLSLFELPAMAFYQLLYQNNIATEPSENIIQDHIKSIDQFFKDIENGILKPDKEAFNKELETRGLEAHFIPKPLVKYLTSVTAETFEVKAKRMLEALIDETVQMIKKVDKQKSSYDQKPGSKDYVELKSGNMADFLARDIIRLQEPLNTMKGKPNSTEFQVLQAKLAYFGANKLTLNDTFKSLNLVGGENPHPYLNKIQISECKGILNFYIDYLKKRKIYLESCLSTAHYHDYFFLNMGRRRKEHGEVYIKNLAKELRTQNVYNLPRGLFLKPILNSLANNAKSKKLADELKELNRLNTAYIIEKYFTEVVNDQPQEFYNYKKNYEFLNKIFDNRSPREMRNTLPQKFFTTEQLTELTRKIDGNTYDNELIRLMNKKVVQETNSANKRFSAIEIKELEEKYWDRYKAFGENEKQIRLAKTCDMVLFMMVDHILRKNFIIDEGSLKKKNVNEVAKPVEFGLGYSLSGIKADSDKGILELQTEARIELPFSYETNIDKLLKISGAKSVLSPLQHKTILREQIKIKNYGDFRALMKDRRISSLLPYVKEDIIYFEALKKELEMYEIARIEVLDIIHNFERNAISVKGLKKEKGKRFISHDDILEKFSEYDPMKRIKIKKLRNAFCHSIYPDYILFKNEIDGSGINKLKDYKADEPQVLQYSPAIQFKNLTNKYYDELIKYSAPPVD